MYVCNIRLIQQQKSCETSNAFSLRSIYAPLFSTILLCMPFQTFHLTLKKVSGLITGVESSLLIVDEKLVY